MGQERDPDWEDMKKRIETAVENGDMTREEADKQYAEIKKRLAMRRERGSVQEMRAKITGHFKKTGFTEEQIKQTWVLMERVMHELKSEGTKFELDPRVKEYMQTTMGLTEKQIESVVGVSRRMLFAKTQGGPSREEMAKVKEEIWAKVKSGEITEEQAKAKWESYLKFVRELQGDKKAGPTREEMAAVKKKIWAGVKEGKISEDDAQKRWQGYLKRFRGGERKARDEDPRRAEMAAYRKRLGEAVKAGTMTEEEAKAEWEAYMERLRGRADR